ncbi:MAG: M20/M25/M40 family metallo-hydrolase, partial [Victivallaceae bacterium]
ILQGHLDMVPCSADGTRDFTSEPVAVVRTGDILHTGGLSTLGADNGIGVALALAALTETAAAGELSVLLTVEEETGLSGAGGLDADMLDADYLINLDSEKESELVVGCAGGARLAAEWPLEWSALPADSSTAVLRVSGLPGGHSGSDIHEGRGNAIRILLELLAEHPELRVISLSGGVVSNVIPSSASAVVAADGFAVLEKSLAGLRERYAVELGVHGLRLKGELSAAPAADMGWTAECAANIISSLLAVPAGVVEFDRVWNVPAVSDNLAIVASDGEKCRVLLSQRAQDDAAREAITSDLCALFERRGATAVVGECYPGWQPRSDSPLLLAALRVFEAMRGHAPQVKVIHAGLECGIFAKKNPRLQMISFGPDMDNVHSVNESLSIGSTERTWEFLSALLAEIWR